MKHIGRPRARRHPPSILRLPARATSFLPHIESFNDMRSASIGLMTNEGVRAMEKRTLAAVACASLIATLTLSSSANAGHGKAVGAGLLGFGIGAIVGSALTPQTVYVSPRPPPDYYAPAGYGPPPWTPAWYRYCRQIHGPYFDARSGYFQAADGGQYFCR